MKGKVMPDAERRDWDIPQRSREERLRAGSKFARSKMVKPVDTTALLEAIVRPGDRICLEGDNQKQADFLAECLAKTDPGKLPWTGWRPGYERDSDTLFRPGLARPRHVRPGCRGVQGGSGVQGGQRRPEWP